MFIRAVDQLAEMVKKTLVANGVKEKDIENYAEAKVQKGSPITFLHEKTTSPLKLRIARVEDMADSDLNMVHEKERVGSLIIFLRCTHLELPCQNACR
ncbi:hypothetical protein [Nitrososphaera sp.]|uniref:hypothetical protein n=1 Tax=Nitrososphaera sp. TaxID=1971748 RepID=UPI002ED84AB7